MATILMSAHVSWPIVNDYTTPVGPPITYGYSTDVGPHQLAHLQRDFVNVSFSIFYGLSHWKGWTFKH
jgi:hypothetical protein